MAHPGSRAGSGARQGRGAVRRGLLAALVLWPTSCFIKLAGTASLCPPDASRRVDSSPRVVHSRHPVIRSDAISADIPVGSGIQLQPMPIADSRALTIELSPVADMEARRGGTNRHFGDISSRYRSVRDADLAAVGLVSDVLATAAAQARPFRLLDVGTGTGRYLDMVSERLSSTLVTDLCPIGLDRSAAMLGQARRLNGCAYPGASHLVAAVETLPIRAASCDALTCFNAVHHFDLARFATEASRVLAPSGLLVLYTRTAAQNRETIWGRYFPEFAELETRLYTVSELPSDTRRHGRLRVSSCADDPMASHDLSVETARAGHRLSLFDVQVLRTRETADGTRHVPTPRPRRVSRLFAYHVQQ